MKQKAIYTTSVCEIASTCTSCPVGTGCVSNENCTNYRQLPKSAVVNIEVLGVGPNADHAVISFPNGRLFTVPLKSLTLLRGDEDESQD